MTDQTTDQMTDLLVAIGVAIDDVSERNGALDSGDLISALIGFSNCVLDFISHSDPETGDRLRAQAIDMLQRGGTQPRQTHRGGAA